MKRLALMLSFVALAPFARAQTNWQRSTVQDALRQSTYDQFVLRGKYLIPPRNIQSGQFPALVVQCQPDRHSVGYHIFVNGKFLDAYLVTGTIVDSQIVVHEGLSGTSFPVVVAVQFRLDNGKLQSDSWRASTDYTAAFFPEYTLYNFLYGHQMRHEENSNPQVHKIIIGIDEALAGEVQIQFDMPDVSDVAEACGVVIHKKQKK